MRRGNENVTLLRCSECCVGAVVLLSLLPPGVHAGNLNFVTINDPADKTLQTPVFNQLLGINNAGVIAGYFGDGTVVNNHGFTWTKGTFANENVPGADQTQVVAINNTLTAGADNTVGFWVNNTSGANHGFTNIGGTFTNVDGPGSTFTQVLGLNDHGEAVGFFTAGGLTSGFTYSLTSTTVTPLTVPSSWNATSVTAAGINNSGVIVGFYSNSSGTSGFIDKNGTFTTPTDPNGTSPMFFGINNLGEVVGTDTAAGGYSEGFVYNTNTNTWTVVFDPNSVTTPDGFGISGTTLNGINDEGKWSASTQTRPETSTACYATSRRNRLRWVSSRSAPCWAWAARLFAGAATSGNRLDRLSQLASPAGDKFVLISCQGTNSP